MQTFSRLRLLILLFVLGLICVPLGAQDAEPPTVPDLTGLTLPVAAAELDAIGLALGNLTFVPWDDANGEALTITAQSLAAGSTFSPGETLDVTVQHPYNVELVYDDNDLTIINLINKEIYIDNLVLRSVDGQGAAMYAADEGRWGAILRPDQCVQVWAVSRNGPKALEDDCRFIQQWDATERGDKHFWTGRNDATQFALIQDGIQRGTCAITGEIGVEQRCLAYLAPAQFASDVLEYLYLTYTADYLVVTNPSDDRWMPLATLHLPNRMSLADSERIEKLKSHADLNLLAPGSCFLLVSDAEQRATETCDPVGRVVLDHTEVFWTRSFEIDGAVSGETYNCPAAQNNGEAFCLIPR